MGTTLSTKELIEREAKARKKLRFQKEWFIKNKASIYKNRDRRRAQLKARKQKIAYGRIYLPILRGTKNQ